LTRDATLALVSCAFGVVIGALVVWVVIGAMASSNAVPVDAPLRTTSDARLRTTSIEDASSAVARPSAEPQPHLPPIMSSGVPASDSRTTAKSSMAAPRPLPTEARLVVTSTPAGARVTVNGVGRGATPVTIPHLSWGEARVRLSKDGYVSAERAVYLTRDRPAQSLRVTLRTRGDEPRRAPRAGETRTLTRLTDGRNLNAAE
jgi:hypothetical protein